MDYSRLDYCNSLHIGLLLRLTWKLQVVQKAAMRSFLGLFVESIYNQYYTSYTGFQ